MTNSIYDIEEVDHLSSDIKDMINQGHIKDEATNNIIYHYQKFVFVVKDNKNSIIGALQAYTAFAEIYLDDIWVRPSYRGQNLGRKLIKALEGKFRNKGYNNINLVTSHFQAPDFYKKCGFEVEFVRINKKIPA